MCPARHPGARALAIALVLALLAGCATGRPTTTTPTPSGPPAGDPTRGQFINATSWSLRVWVDGDPMNTRRTPTVVLQPGEAMPWTLSHGEHRVVAHAHPAARTGEQVVARFDRTIRLDPQRVDGWYLRFREADFR